MIKKYMPECGGGGFFWLIDLTKSFVRITPEIEYN